MDISLSKSDLSEGNDILTHAPAGKLLKTWSAMRLAIFCARYNPRPALRSLSNEGFNNSFVSWSGETASVVFKQDIDSRGFGWHIYM